MVISVISDQTVEKLQLHMDFLRRRCPLRQNDRHHRLQFLVQQLNQFIVPRLYSLLQLHKFERKRFEESDHGNLHSIIHKAVSAKRANNDPPVVNL